MSSWGPRKADWPRLKSSDVDAIMRIIEEAMPPGIPDRKGARDPLAKMLHSEDARRLCPTLHSLTHGTSNEAVLYSALALYAWDHVVGKILEHFQRVVRATPGMHAHVVIDGASHRSPFGGATFTAAAPEGALCASCGEEVLSGWTFPSGGTWCNKCTHVIRWS